MPRRTTIGRRHRGRPQQPPVVPKATPQTALLRRIEALDRQIREEVTEDEYRQAMGMVGRDANAAVRCLLRWVGRMPRSVDSDAQSLALLVAYKAANQIVLPSHLRALFNQPLPPALADRAFTDGVAAFKAQYVGAMPHTNRPLCALLTCPRPATHPAQGFAYCEEHRGVWLLVGLQQTHPGAALLRLLGLKEDPPAIPVGAHADFFRAQRTVARYAWHLDAFWGYGYEHGSDAYYRLVGARSATAAGPLVAEVLSMWRVPMAEVAADARFLAEFMWDHTVRAVPAPWLVPRPLAAELRPTFHGAGPNHAALRAIADVQRAYLRHWRPPSIPEPVCEVLACWAGGSEFIHDRWYCTKHRGVALLCGLRRTVPDCAFLAACALKSVATLRDHDSVGTLWQAPDVARLIGKYNRWWGQASRSIEPLFRRMKDSTTYHTACVPSAPDGTHVR